MHGTTRTGRIGTLLAALGLLAAAGCPPQPDDEPDDDEVHTTDSGGRGETATPDPAAPDGPAATRDDGTESLLGDALAGRTLETVEDGPWVVRRVFTERVEHEAGDGGALADGLVAEEMRGDAADDVATDLPMRAMVETEPAALASATGGTAGRGSGGAGLGGAGRPSAGRAKRSREAPADVAMASTPAQTATPMRAGSTDDNDAFDAYLQFLAEWSQQPHVGGQMDRLDVADRRQLRVVDRVGAPVPGARVALVDEAADRIVWRGTTYGDGALPFYPDVATEGADEAAGPRDLLVEVHAADGTHARTRWAGDGDELVVTLDGAATMPTTIPLDVLFLIDTTGSMSDEIERIKATLLRVTERLRGLEQEFDLHYAAVLYRDIGDVYVTRAHPFTDDIEAFAATLQEVTAGGGGDGPESLNQGLAHAVSMPGWRDGAAKVMFLIADAPPHMDYAGDTPYGDSLRAAVGEGIRVHAVAASGLDPFGTLVFRQTAQFTRGKFIFIEYGSTAASAASHGVGGPVASNNLDDILYEQIAGELAGWGRPPQQVAVR